MTVIEELLVEFQANGIYPVDLERILDLGYEARLETFSTYQKRKLNTSLGV